MKLPSEHISMKWYLWSNTKIRLKKQTRKNTIYSWTLNLFTFFFWKTKHRWMQVNRDWQLPLQQHVHSDISLVSTLPRHLHFLWVEGHGLEVRSFHFLAVLFVESLLFAAYLLLQLPLFLRLANRQTHLWVVKLLAGNGGWSMQCCSIPQ